MELVNYWTGEEARKGRTIEEFARYKRFLQLSLRMRLPVSSFQYICSRVAAAAAEEEKLTG